MYYLQQSSFWSLDHIQMLPEHLQYLTGISNLICLKQLLLPPSTHSKTCSSLPSHLSKYQGHFPSHSSQKPQRRLWPRSHSPTLLLIISKSISLSRRNISRIGYLLFTTMIPSLLQDTVTSLLNDCHGLSLGFPTSTRGPLIYLQQRDTVKGGITPLLFFKAPSGYPLQCWDVSRGETPGPVNLAGPPLVCYLSTRA